MTQKELIERFAQAIARKEDWYKRGKIPSVSQRLSNPLGLTHARDEKGARYPVVCGYVQFPDEQSGWRAGRSLCYANIAKRGLTWREFFSGKRGVYQGFCQSQWGKQDPVQYAIDIMASFGVTVPLNTPIRELVGDGTELTGRIAA